MYTAQFTMIIPSIIEPIYNKLYQIIPSLCPGVTQFDIICMKHIDHV